MKDTIEFLGNDNKSRFRKYENILSALNLDEMFPSSENDDDTKETYQWVLNEKKKIDNNEYNNPNAQTLNISIYERPILDDMQNQPQELVGINNINIEYKLEPKDALDVSIKKLWEYANSLPADKRDLQYAASDLATKLAKMKWAASVLTDFKENPDAFENQEKKNNFVVAQKILKDLIDTTNNGVRKFDIKDAFNKFNKLDEFKHITEHYCCVIDRFINTTESVAFELEELDHQIVEDNAYKEIQDRKILSIKKEKEFDDKLNNEIDTIITKGYDPESMYNEKYNTDFLLSIDPIEKSINNEKGKLINSEKELADAKNQFKKNVEALIKEREEFEKSNNQIINDLIIKEETKIKGQISYEKDEINTNQQIIEATEDKIANIAHEIEEIDKQAYVDEITQFRNLINDCTERYNKNSNEVKKINNRLKEINTTFGKINKGDIKLDENSIKELQDETTALVNQHKELTADIKADVDMRNFCLDTLKIKKAYNNKLKELNEKNKTDELKKSLAENEKLLAEKEKNYVIKYSAYKEKYENIKSELNEDEEFKLENNIQPVEQNANETWNEKKHSVIENYNHYSDEVNKYNSELDKLIDYAPEKYGNVIYGYCQYMVDYQQFSKNYASVLCGFKGLDPSFFENPAEVSENIKNYLNKDHTKEQEEFLNQPANTSNSKNNMTNREVMLMIVDNYDVFRRNFILSQLDMKNTKVSAANLEFMNSDEYKKAEENADKLIKKFAKTKNKTVLQQMHDVILNNGKKLETDFNNLSKELYDIQKKQVLEISNKYNSKIGEVTATIYNLNNLSDPFDYFDPSNIEITRDAKSLDGKSFISTVKVDAPRKFGLTTDRSILTSLAIGKILQNERMSDKVKGRGKETGLYNDVFDPTKNLVVKNKLAQGIINTYNIKDDNICRLELAKEMLNSLSTCVDIIDDRMYQLNGDMSAKTLLDPNNKYILKIADVLIDIGQDIEKKGTDNKSFVDILKENCKTQEEKDNIDKIILKGSAVAQIIGIHSNNLGKITEFANMDLSKGVDGSEKLELFSAIERIKATEKFTKQEISKDGNWNTTLGVKSSLKKNFSDILTESQEVEILKGKNKVKVQRTKANIIFDAMNSSAPQMMYDKSIKNILGKLDGPNEQGICGINLLAKNYLENPSNIPGVDFKYDANTTTVSNINAKSFNNYIGGLKLKEPNNKAMVNVSGQLQALKGVVNYNPLIRKINQNIKDRNTPDHFHNKYKMEKEMKSNYLRSVDLIMDKDSDEINSIKRKVDSTKEILETGKNELDNLNNKYEENIKSLPINNLEQIYFIRNAAKAKKENIDTELKNKIKEANIAIKNSKDKIEKLETDLKNVKPNIQNNRKDIIEEEIKNLKIKTENTIKGDLNNINSHELEVNNHKTVIKNMEAALDKITQKTADIAECKKNLSKLKNEKITFMNDDKNVIDNSNSKIQALPNEKARVDMIKMGIADLYNSLEVARDKKHSDTPEFKRMKTALSAAMTSNSFADMKTKLEEINAAAKNYITEKNSIWVPRTFASNMRIARLNAARNIETFCKNKIETCKKYESPYNSEINSFVDKYQSQEVNNIINASKDRVDVKQVFGDQFKTTVDKKMNKINIDKNAKSILANAVGDFAKNANNECNENIQNGKNKNQTVYSNIEKEIPDKAKNIRENIMQLKKNDIDKLFNKNVGIQNNGPQMEMI